MKLRTVVAACLILNSATVASAQTLDAYDRPADAATARAQRAQIDWLTNAYIADSVYLKRALAARGGAFARRSHEIQETRTRLLRGLQDMSPDDPRRDRLRAALDRNNATFAELVRLTASDSRQVAAYEQTISTGVAQVVTQADKGATAALQRYLKGDASALDDLQGLINLEDQAREAAQRKETGDKLRFVALLMDNERENGRRTARQTLAAFEAAAGRDPDNFYQWTRIAELARSLGDDQTMASALSQAKRLAIAPIERAQLLKFQPREPLADADGPTPGPEEQALAIYRDEYRLHPSASPVLLALINQLQIVAAEIIAPILDDGKPLDDARRATLKRARTLIDQATAFTPKFREIEANQELRDDLERAQSSVIGDLERASDNGVAAKEAYARSLSMAKKLSALHPDSVLRAMQLEGAARNSALYNGTPQQLLDTYIELAKEADRRFASDPDVVDNIWDVWSTHTDVGLMARTLGRYDLSEAAFEAALGIGRKVGETHGFGFMVDLTLPRLAIAKMGRGDLQGAKAVSLEELKHYDNKLREKQLTEDERRQALSEQFDAWLGLGNISAIAGDYKAAISIYRSADQFSDRNYLSKSISQNDHTQYHLVILYKFADSYIKMGMNGDYINTANEILKLLKSLDYAPSEKSQQAFSILSVEAALADAPGSGVTWARVQAAAENLQASETLSREQKIALVEISRLSGIRAKESTGDTFKNMLERVRESLDVIYADYQKSGDKILEGIVLSYLGRLEMLPGSDISAQQILDFVRPMVIYRSGGNDLAYYADELSGKIAVNRKP